MFGRILSRRRRAVLSSAVASVVGLIGPYANAQHTWDTVPADAAVTGGTGVWDLVVTNWTTDAGATNVAWDNGTPASAIFGGTAGTVTINNAGTGVSAAGLTFNSTGYIIAGQVVGDVLNLNAATPTIAVTNGADTATINALLTGTNGFIKSGAGTLVLGGNSAGLSGAVAINAGVVQLTNIGGLGTGAVAVNAGGTLRTALTGVSNLANNVTIDGGTLQFNPGTGGTNTLQMGAGVITVGAGGATFNNGGAGGLANSKILLAAGKLTGAGAISKTGDGTFQLAGANAGYTGTSVTINQGVVEFQNVDALGTGTATIAIGPGEFASTGVAVRHNFTLNTGAVLSNNSATAMTYTGALTMAGNATIAPRFFNTTGTGSTITINNLAGTGNLSVNGPTGGSGTVVLSGVAAGYTGGTIRAGSNAIVQLRGNLNLTGPSIGVAGINASYYNFGANPNASNNPTEFISHQLVEPGRVFTRTDTNINIPNGGGGVHPVVPVPGYQFNVNDGAMWKGLLNVTTAGSYQFSAINDDNAVLIIDGVQIGTIGVSAGGANLGTAVNLTAGPHSIVYKFTQGGGGGYTALRYNGPDSGGSTVVIPGSTTAGLSTGSLAATTVTGLGTTTGTGSFDIITDTITPTMTLGSGTTLNVNSPLTLSSMTVSGATTLEGATVTINANTNLRFDGAIGQSAASAVTLNGVGRTTFAATNTYTGLTTVTNGQLVLDAAGGTAIPADLTINAPNALGFVRNVVIAGTNQIADSSTVTVTNGVLDIRDNNETIGALTVNGVGAIVTGGTTGVLSAGTYNLSQGTILARLGGTGGISKGTAGNIILAGNNTYTGATTLTAGVITIRNSGALGATGGANATFVNDTTQLVIQNSITTGETITIDGSGFDGTGALRSISGNNAISTSLTLGGSSAATVRVDSGTLAIPGFTGGTLTKTGNGVLAFSTPLASFPGSITHTGGALGFVGDGTQAFGAIAVPAGLAYQFTGDPGAGTTLTAAAGTAVLNGGATANNGLLSRVTGAGTFGLTEDSTGNLSFAGKGTLGLGAKGLVSYSGTITPDASGYQFGGVPAGVSGVADNRLTLTTALTGTNAVTVTGGTVNLSSVVNTQTGAVNIAGGAIEIVNDTSLGNPANAINLSNGGVLRLNNVSGSAGQIFGHLGNPINGGGRVVNVGTGGGTIDVPSQAGGNNGYALTGGLTTALTGDPLSGTGTLTKTGLGFLFLSSASDFEGNIVLAANSNQFDIRGVGSWVPSVPTNLSVGTAASVNIDNRNGLGSGRQFINGTSILDRIGQNVTINLQGGTLNFFARNAAGQVSESLGTINALPGQSFIQPDKEGQGADLTIANLVANSTGATVRFGGDAGTFGATGDNARVVLTQLNGSALGANVPIIGGFATIFGSSFVGTGATAGSIVAVNGTDQGAAAFVPVAATLYNLNAAGTATVSDEGDNAAEMTALRFGNNAAQTLAFADAADTLYISSGGVLSDGNNQTRAIGATVGSGLITAGAVGAATPQQLFFHNNSNTMTVNSVIIDNPGGGSVAVVKDLDGQVTLTSANSYTGGTFVNRGTLQANAVSSLGGGDVLVRNSRLNLQVGGTTLNPTDNFEAVDGGEILLNNNNFAATTSDRFTIRTNSVIIGPNATNGNQGLNTLTRNTTMAAAGDIVLEPGAIVGHQHNFVGETGAGIATIKNLGTNADLYFGLSNTFSDPRTFVTLGAGTPWKGMSTDRSSRTWEEGTIVANSDFWLQGMLRDGGYAALSLGSGSTGSYVIQNVAGQPINAFVAGQVILAEDALVSIPSDLTFVVTSGALLQPNITSQLGTNANAALNARIRVLAGGTLDPGGFVGVGATVNMPQGHPYPVASPLNGQVLVEAGGRMIVNDASGIGSTTPGSWIFRENAVLDLGNAQAFLGATSGGPNSGLINAGQFVFDVGTIVRLTGDNRFFKLDQFVNQEPNGQRLVYQIFNSDKSMTDAVDPRIVNAVGTSTVVPMNFTLANGGMLTNDNSDRTVRERRGNLILNNGAVLAGTTQTYFNIQENMSFAAGATIDIGSTKWIDGQPKTGAVQFTGTANNTAGVGAILNVTDKSHLSFAGVHTAPDNINVSLPNAVTLFPAPGGSSPQPGNGSSLLLNTANYLEIISTLTGQGAVIANTNVDGTNLGVGFGAGADFTFDGGFRGNFAYTNRNPSLTKVGPTKMTLTGLNDTLGDLAVLQGEVAIAGPNGSWRGGNLRIARGGVMTIDNSGTAVAGRIPGTGFLSTLGGGEFRLLGHTTQVADVTITGLANSAGTLLGTQAGGGNTGGFGKINVVPGIGTTSLVTSLTFGNFERFDNAGEKNAVWLFRGPAVAGLPGTYVASAATTGLYTPNVGNPKDGLAFITTPQLTGANAFGLNGGTEGLIHGAPGTPVVPVRGDFLANVNATAVDGDFATIDVASGTARTGVRVLQASEYTNNISRAINAPTNNNIRLTAPTAFTFGDTSFQVLKLENGSGVTVSGTLPQLTQPSQVNLRAGGILVPAGATASLTASDNGAAPDSVIRTNGGVSAYVHAFGDLNVSGEFFSDTGLIKTGAGTATFAAGSLSNLRGRIAVHEGTLNLNNSIANVRNTGVTTVAFGGTHLELNGGTVNINGNSQHFGRLEAGNILPGATTEGGTLTNTGALATVRVQDGGTFSGHVNGAISLEKVGNNTLGLYNTNTMSGPLVIRQGTVLLRDGGSLPNVTQIDIANARLDFDSGYTTALPGTSPGVNAINPAATVNMRGGDIVHRGRAGALTQQTFATVNLQGGHNLMQTLAGGGGASETSITNLNRSAGATVSFQQNYGFVGTLGNDTTAIRYFLNNVTVNGGPVTNPAALLAANNGILGGWAIVNNDQFATYDAVRGVGALGNTEDGFAAYGSGDLSTATATQNVNDGTARTIAASKTVNAIRFNGNVNHTINAGQVLTVNTGGILSNTNGAHGFISTGQLTSNSGELNFFVQQNTMTVAAGITGNIAVTKAGSGTLTLSGTNNYTGVTYVGQGSNGASSPAGTLNAGAVGSIPGDLVINKSTVTATVAGGIAGTSNVTLFGGAILNMRDAASTSETLASLTFIQGGGDANNRAIVARANLQATSSLNLTAATAITSTNDNPTATPTISNTIGTVNFTGAGAKTLQLNSNVTVNGLAAAALVFNSDIGTVPTGIAEGGLIKAGSGLLILGGTGIAQFGNPGVAGTEVFNIQSGFVRADQVGALGPANAVTTVQSGATLLYNSNSTGVTGSLRLKGGSTVGLTINSSVLGAVGGTSIMDLPSGTVDFQVRDYFIPGANNGNLVINHQVTGSGTMNLIGIEFAAGYNGGGLLQLRNEANTYSGTVNVNTNTVFESSTNAVDLTGNAFGTATINLAGGTLRVRDAGNNLAGAQTIAYGNNITLSAPSYVNLDRQGTVATNKTFDFGTLTVAAGTQSLFVANGNGYIMRVATLDGPGTFVKTGVGPLEVGALGGGFSGNIEIPGPIGLNLGYSGGLNLPAATSLANLTVGGILPNTAGRTINVTGALTVGNNAGQATNGVTYNGTSYVPYTNGDVVGSLVVSNTATITTPSLVNNGQVWSSGGAATVGTGATSISGTGKFATYGLTGTPENLTVNGTLAGAGTTLKVAGTNTVNFNPAGTGTSTGGVQVQKGVLNIASVAPVTNPLGSGTISVYGWPASTLGVGTQPIAASASELRFNATAGAITQSSNINNHGLVRVTGGTTTISGVISGSAATTITPASFLANTVPGLVEGRLTSTAGLVDTDANAGIFTAARPAANGNFGIVMEPRMAQTNIVTGDPRTGWSDNTTWTYTGYFYDADGLFAFAENIDDNTLISIDGVTRLNTGGDRITSTATTKGQRGGTFDTANVNTAAVTDLINTTPLAANPNLPAGWHSLEIRVNNGGGGAGPWGVTNGFTNNYGLGLNSDGTMALDGSVFFRPIDAGDGQLFRSAVYGRGSVTVDAGATLQVNQITNNTTITNDGILKLNNIDYVGSFAGRSTTDTLVNNVTGLVDVNTTGIVIANAVEATVRSQIVSGRNAGAWTGTTGITSSAAIADPTNRAVGYFVNGAEITVAQTIPGDSNLDGIVNVLDRGTYLANVGQSPRNWQQADWNYDDIVNVLDRAIYLGHVGMSLPTPPPFGAGSGSAGDALGAMSGSGSGTPMLDGPVGGNTTPGDGVPAVTYDPTTGKLMLDTDGLSNINAIFLPVSPQSRFVTVVGDIDGAAGANWSQFYAGGQNWESALFTPAGNLTMGTWELATMQTGLSTSVFSGGIQFILQNGNLVNTTVEVVPEPTGLALAAMAGLGLLARRRRR